MTRTRERDDEIIGTLVTTTDTPALLQRVSWGGILAGSVVALGLLILLGLLGSALGLGSIDPGRQSAGGSLGWGVGIWWAVTSIIALGIGGFIAGRLAGMPDKHAATAHGASVWGVVTIVTFWLAASSLGTALNTAATGVTTAADAVQGVLANTSVTMTEAELREAAREGRETIANTVPDRPAAVADNAADALASAAWYAFFTSLVALIAAMVAAGAGAPNRALMTASEKIEKNA